MSATLRLERGMPMAVGDRKRSWQILLDGKNVGQIALSEAFETSIEPGRHTLQLTSTNTRRSPERAFTAADESVTEFSCHVQPIWPLLLMALVLPGRWIALKQR
jgi:hypothetical protein